MSENDPRSWFDNLPTDQQVEIETENQSSDEPKEPPAWDGVWPAR